MSPGNSHAKNGLVDRIAPKPDNCQVDQVDYQAGNSRYGHELVEPGNYAQVGAEVESIQIYDEKPNRHNRQKRLRAVMGSGKSGRSNTSLGCLSESFKSPSAVEDKKDEQSDNVESVLPGNGRRLACLALGAEKQQYDDEVDELIIHSGILKPPTVKSNQNRFRISSKQSFRTSSQNVTG